MRLTRIRAVVGVGVLAVAGTTAAVALAVAPASAGAAAAHAAAAAKVVLVNQCTGGGQVRPSTIPLPECMTSSELIGHARWTSWGSVAFGAGDLEVNNCTPSSSCGPSQYTKYPILIVLWRAEPREGGGRYFTRLTWILTGKRPSHAPVTQTITMLPAAE